MLLTRPRSAYYPAFGVRCSSGLGIHMLADENRAAHARMSDFSTNTPVAGLPLSVARCRLERW